MNCAWLDRSENELRIRICLFRITGDPPPFPIFADVHRSKNALHHLPRESTGHMSRIRERTDYGFQGCSFRRKPFATPHIFQAKNPAGFVQM